MQLNRIIGEPLAKNTAPCIALANRHIKQLNPNAIVLVAPSDHLILNENAFFEIANRAFSFASENNALLTLGIKPTRPDTGYGYIQFNKEEINNHVHRVKTFTEKPTHDIAISFIESKEFLWNAGIFVWSLKTIENSIQKYLPELHQIFQDLDVISPAYKNDLEKAYALCPSISIDYGILEKDDFVAVLPSEFGWSDLGTWKSLWDISNKDANNNALIGKSVHAFDSSNSIVFNDSNKLVVISGVDNLVVVESDAVLMIINKDKEQEVKTVLNSIKETYKNKYD
jgi:mannose-1-phosphate guanylyltransferase